MELVVPRRCTLMTASTTTTVGAWTSSREVAGAGAEPSLACHSAVEPSSSCTGRKRPLQLLRVHAVDNFLCYILFIPADVHALFVFVLFFLTYLIRQPFAGPPELQTLLLINEVSGFFILFLTIVRDFFSSSAFFFYKRVYVAAWDWNANSSLCSCLLPLCCRS